MSAFFTKYSLITLYATHGRQRPSVYTFTQLRLQLEMLSSSLANSKRPWKLPHTSENGMT